MEEAQAERSTHAYRWDILLPLLWSAG